MPRLSPPELPASSIPKELADPAPLRFSLPGEWIDRHGRSVPKLDIRRIVVLKADHIGDLLIAGPAFGLLRRFFPFAQIDLICGPWNVTLARKLGIFDNVYGISLFHEVGGRQSDLEIARGAQLKPVDDSATTSIRGSSCRRWTRRCMPGSAPAGSVRSWTSCCRSKMRRAGRVTLSTLF